MGKAIRGGRRARAAKADDRGPMQRIIDANRLADEQSFIDVITPEQRAKGTYDGERRIVNRGGTPVMRWIAAGKLSDTQAISIQLCYRLWGVAGLSSRTTSSYGERIPAAVTQDERLALVEIEAREDLHRFQDYVPALYWSIFENVCRFDEPAGVAGSRLGFGARSAEDRAHMVVCFVADTIAMREGLIPAQRIRCA